MTDQPQHLQPPPPAPSATSQSPTPPPHAAQPAEEKRGRRRRPKVKTGCANCKQRRIKCDEARPACSQCVRSKKDCVGYPPPSRYAVPYGELRIAPRPAPPNLASSTSAPSSAPPPRGPGLAPASLGPGRRHDRLSTSPLGTPPPPPATLASHAPPPSIQAPLPIHPALLLQQQQLQLQQQHQYHQYGYHAQRHQQQRQLQPSPSSLTIPRQPSSPLGLSEVEGRYFDLFLSQTASELSGYFDHTFWTQSVPQACHLEPAIRHAAVAMGALYKTLEQSSRTPSPDASPQSGARAVMSHWNVAVRRYSDACNALVLHGRLGGTTSPARSHRCRLIASVLLACFDAFIGDHRQAIVQIQTGIALLNRLTRPRARGSATSSSDQRSRSSSGGRSSGANSMIAAAAAGAAAGGAGTSLLDVPGTPDMLGTPRSMAILDVASLASEDLDYDDDDENSSSSEPIADDLLAMFTRVACQAKSYDMAFHFPAPYVIRLTTDDDLIGDGEAPYSSHRRPPPPPLDRPFNDLRDARRAFDAVSERVLRAVEGLHLVRRQLYPVFPASWASSVQGLRASIDAWGRAFQPIFESRLDPGSPLTACERAGAAMLKMTQINMAVLIRCFFNDTESQFDGYLPHFRQVVDLGYEVLPHARVAAVDPASAAALAPVKPSFVADMGIIPPVYVVATKCRHPVVRRQAIHLLRYSARREAMWDSELAARIAEWVMNLEEGSAAAVAASAADHHRPGVIPEQCRVMVHSVDFDLRAHRADLSVGPRCATFPDSTMASYLGSQTTHIAW